MKTLILSRLKKTNHLFFTFSFLLIIFNYLLSSCTSNEDKRKSNLAVPPLFKNSIVSTDIDFITECDADSFKSYVYIGQQEKEMPDSRNDILFDKKAYVFESTFANGKKVGIWAHSSFGSKAAAEEYVVKLNPRLGKLPELMRDKVSHVIIHKGDATAFAESEGNFFVLYSDNMDVRISNNDLEETVFHESVHASLDFTYANSTGWKNAQNADGNFITQYGKDNPKLEDLAETAIFAYTMIKNPGRLSKDIEDWVNKNNPNKFAFFKTIYK